MCAVAAPHQRHQPCSRPHTGPAEDYLEAVFDLTASRGSATTSSLAELLAVAPPSVSAMLNRLAVDDLVVRSAAHRVELTDHGKRHAVGGGPSTSAGRGIEVLEQAPFGRPLGVRLDGRRIPLGAELTSLVFGGIA